MSWEQSALAAYRAQLSSRKALTPELELALVERYHRGDRAAGARLIEACLPFVLTIALEYRRWGVPLEDVIQEGNIGLLKAADRFDPARGCRLVTYAAYWIRAEIRDYVVRAYRIVRLGASKGERRALRFYRRTRERSAAALAEQSGLSIEKAEALLPVLTQRDVDLDARDGEHGTPSDRLAHPGPSPEDEVSTREEQDKLALALRAAVGQLAPRERTILEQRWLAEEPLTLEQVGVRFGISKERVRQLEERAKKQLRARIELLLRPAPPIAA
jgi:RNA polymerase sigma-32 factor